MLCRSKCDTGMLQSFCSLSLSLSLSLSAVHTNLPDIFYVCVMMMGHGCVSTRAAIHGVLINSIHALLSLPQVLNNGEKLHGFFALILSPSFFIALEFDFYTFDFCFLRFFVAYSQGHRCFLSFHHRQSYDNYFLDAEGIF